jgi:hypothetical protein
MFSSTFLFHSVRLLGSDLIADIDIMHDGTHATKKDPQVGGPHTRFKESPIIIAHMSLQFFFSFYNKCTRFRHETLQEKNKQLPQGLDTDAVPLPATSPARHATRPIGYELGAPLDVFVAWGGSCSAAVSRARTCARGRQARLTSLDWRTFLR